MFWCYPGQQNACVSVEEEERESPRGAACVGLAERARPKTGQLEENNPSHPLVVFTGS